MQITLEKLNKINEELKKIKNIEIKKILKEIIEAKSYGDLSENPEYQFAKKKKVLLEKKIKQMEDIISNCEIIEKNNKEFSEIKLQNVKNKKIHIIKINKDKKEDDFFNIKILELLKEKKIEDIIKIKKYNKEYIFKILEIK